MKNGVTAKKTKIILKFLILLSLLKFNTIKITKNIGNLYALLKKKTCKQEPIDYHVKVSIFVILRVDNLIEI